MKVSHDAIQQWQDSLKRLFEKQVADSKVSWIMLASSRYKPGVDSAYDLRNSIMRPIVFSSSLDVDELPGIIERRAQALASDEELSLSVEVVVGWSSGVVVLYDMGIFDGAPGLSDLIACDRTGFAVLKTGNGHHFYKLRESTDVPSSILDHKWIAFKSRGAGYIRVTSNVKGPITLLSLK